MQDAVHRASLGAVVSAMTGRLLCPLEELFALQDFLSGRRLTTVERSAAFREHAPVLARQFPELDGISPPPLTISELPIRLFLSGVAARVGWESAEVKRPS